MSTFKSKLSLKYAPTLQKFLEDRSDIRIIKGPVGSGKTTGLCFAVLTIAMMQERSPKDGVRYTRPVILRNTYSELKTTTIKTWEENFPQDQFGSIGGTPPITQHIKIPGQLDCEVYFLAIDQPKDVRKLLSLNISHLFFNEMREFNEDLIKRSWDRVGRYPAPGEDKQGVECTYPCMIGDTNPPDEDHWMYSWEHGEARMNMDEDSPLSLKFFNQPGAVLDVSGFNKEKIAAILADNPMDSKAEAYLRAANKEHAQEKGLKNFWKGIKAAGREYMVNPLAENIPNLRKNYYPSKVPFNNREDIRVYYQSKYGVVGHGKPVIPEYNDDLMSVEDLAVLKDVPLGIGADVGGGTLSPSALICQRHPRGVIMVHAEIVCFDMGNEEFCNQINQTLAELFSGRQLEYGYGDPAGMTRDEIFETIVFDFMRSKGIPIKGAQTNNIPARIEAIRNPMTKMIDGKPGILINKRCKVLRAGLAGKWVFRRLQIVGSERYADKPDKGKYSHIADALGYYNLGSGEYQAIHGRKKRENRKPVRVKTGWDVFK